MVVGWEGNQKNDKAPTHPWSEKNCCQSGHKSVVDSDLRDLLFPHSSISEKSPLADSGLKVMRLSPPILSTWSLMIITTVNAESGEFGGSSFS